MEMLLLPPHRNARVPIMPGIRVILDSQPSGSVEEMVGSGARQTQPGGGRKLEREHLVLRYHLELIVDWLEVLENFSMLNG